MLSRSRNGTTKQKQMIQIAEEYMQVHDVDEIDPAEVAKWATSTGRYTPREFDPEKECKKDLTRALGAEHQIDPQGREVRSHVPIPIKSIDGQTHWDWVKIFKCSPDKFKLSQSVRRKGILADCRQHQVDSESYNDNNEHGAQVDLFDYNFNLDLEEERLPTEYPEESPSDE